MHNQPATVRDSATRLDMQGFTGNDLTVQLNVQGDGNMPVVSCVVSDSDGLRLLPAAMQPGVSTSGRVAVLTFTNTKRYREAGTVDVLFGDRIVLSGKLRFSRDTIDGATTDLAVNVTIAGGDVVNVTVLIGASAGGGTDANIVSLITNETIPVGRLVVNVGGKASLYNPLTPTHAYALIGISTQSAPVSETVTVRTKGTVIIPGWGLISGQTYRAGQSGNLSITKPVGGFSQIVGRAISADSFLFNPQPIIY